MKSNVLVFILLNTFFGCLYAAAEYTGIVNTALESDTTYLTPLMLLLFACTMLFITRDVIIGRHRNVLLYDFLGSCCVTLGMVGTVYGFFISLSGVDPALVGNVDAIGPMVAKLIEGMGIALWTTLTGISLYLVIAFNTFILRYVK